MTAAPTPPPAPDLASWLLERVAEDEAVARAATAGPWVALTFYPGRSSVASKPLGEADPDGDPEVARTPAKRDADVAHIARHDPARVLANCAAVRAVVELHYDFNADLGGWGHSICAVCHDYVRHDAERWPCDTLRALAQPYAGAEGWREEWAT